jgi:AcrR family transcriptional regulator
MPLGRPPATASAETRARILLAARECFSQFGYAKTTNKEIATRAGITAGAIYHYFESKQALFVAVVEEVQRVIFDELRDAVAGQPDLASQVRALLDRSVELHARDPWLARFISIEPVELTRHEELRGLMSAGQAAVFHFFLGLAQAAEGRGELARGIEPQAVANMLVAATMGLALFAAVSDNDERHRAATEAFQRLVDGSLLTRGRQRQKLLKMTVN